MNLHSCWALTKREYFSFFRSMTGWVLLSLFSFLSSFLTLSLGQFLLKEGEVNSELYFQTISLIFNFLLPALSMGIWAEEHRRGTLDLIKSLPFSLKNLVFFKSLGIYLVFLTLMIITLPFLIITLPLANFEPGVVTTQLIGIFMLGITQLSFGILISALSKGQIISYLVTLSSFFLLIISGSISLILGINTWLGKFFSFLSMEFHYSSFRKGIFSSSDFLYFFLLSLLFIWLTKAVLEKSKES